MRGSGADGEGLEVVGELVGARVELAVGELGGAGDDGGHVGGPAGLVSDEIVEAGLGGEDPCGRTARPCRRAHDRA